MTDDESNRRTDDESNRRYVEENRAHWDELATHHPDTDVYDVEAFLDGESTIRPLERDELDVEGRTMLHLQCHFGMDTLSWVRDEGVSHATGVDFSQTAIETARDLRDRIGLTRDAVRFVESDVYELDEKLSETFEIVFTSYGVLCWLPDLHEWAAVVADSLEDGGRFYIVDEHPIAGMLGFDSRPDDLRFAYPYFDDDPITEDVDGSYAGSAFGLTHTRQHQFSHSLGELVTALASAGLSIEFLHEFEWSFYQRLPPMDVDERGAGG